MEISKHFLIRALSVGVALSVAQAASAALVGQYTFDDADIVSGKTQDNKVGAIDAVPTGTNGGSSITTGAAGKIGQAYSFERDALPGGGGTVALSEFENLMTIAAGVAPSGSSERTISIWFNQSAATTGQDKLWGYGTNVSGQAIDLSLEGNGIRIRHFGGNITYGTGFDFDGTDAGWHHVAVRVNSGASTFADVDVFLDGVELTVSATGGGGTGVTINTANSAFGIASTSIDTGFAVQNGFNGSLDELRIYDNALTDQEIAALAVPEPASLSLVALGGLMMTVRRRRD
ncbi:MAG: LamG-like jellyroll fold domain-containing protein [Planctomycetota bacterium]